jgi:ribonucleoside-diphosphate reductase beta chain
MSDRRTGRPEIDSPARAATAEDRDNDWYRPAMAERQDWDYAFDPATGMRRRQEEVQGRILPSSRWPNFFSRVVAKLQWDEQRIDLAPDAEAFRAMPDERRERLTKILAGFRVADDAVSTNLEPFGPAANNSLIAWVVFLQKRDEKRHARFFDRVAAEVLELPGETKEDRDASAAELAPPGILKLFREELPAMSAAMEDGDADLSDGMALYHMSLEGMVLSAGQRALLEDLEDGAMPGVREGVYHVELDERWHIGFGLRCLIDRKPSHELIDAIMGRAEECAAAWGDAIPEHIRESVVPMARRRLAYAEKQIQIAAAAA